MYSITNWAGRKTFAVASNAPLDPVYLQNSRWGLFRLEGLGLLLAGLTDLGLSGAIGSFLPGISARTGKMDPSSIAFPQPQI